MCVYKVNLEMVRVYCSHGAPWFGTMVSYSLLVDTLQVCTQGLLALQQDSTDVTGNCRSLVQSLHMLFQAVVVLEYLSTVRAFILLASFCQQDRAFWVAALKVVDQVLCVMGDSLPVKAKLSVN